MGNRAAPVTVTIDTMLPPSGRENLSYEAFHEGPSPVHQASGDKQTVKGKLHICLSECIDDASTVASDGRGSPALLLQDISDGESAHSSPKEMDTRSGSNESPRSLLAHSLEDALGVAPTFPGVAAKSAKPKTQISLEAMLGLTPEANHPDHPSDQKEGTMASLEGDARTPSQTPLTMAHVGGADGLVP